MDPVTDPILPEKFLGYNRESNPGPLGWQSDILPIILITKKIYIINCLLLLGFTTLLNILGHQRRFQSVKRRTNFAQRLSFRLEVLLRAVNLRHGTHGFTSFPKEVILRIFTL